MSSPTMQPVPDPKRARLVYAGTPEAEQQVALGEADLREGRYTTYHSVADLKVALLARRGEQ